MEGAIGYAGFFLTVALIYGIVCLGLNLQWGYAGLFNVGVAGFIAIGAYTDALLTAGGAEGRFGGFGLPVPLGWAAAMLASGAAGLLLGAATLRLRADYLAITTFGAAASVQLVALNAQSVTGGPFGIAFIPRPFAAWATDGQAFALANLLLVTVIAGAVFWALERLTRSPWGRVLRAIREDEAAAAALGKNPDRQRLRAFTIGCAVMGLAGALQAQFFGFIAPDNYAPTLTFQIWVMLVLGGAGNNRGAMLGALVVWAIWTGSGAAIAGLLPQDWQARAASLRLVLIGIALAAVLLWRPRGLLGEIATVSRHLRPAAAARAPGNAGAD